ncbi:MAG: TM2 domain-containing protein [Flavobacteriales bacterium]|nr:TM2 domain-containing protein [Flavobacteriales bacterium]
MVTEAWRSSWSMLAMLVLLSIGSEARAGGPFRTEAWDLVDSVAGDDSDWSTAHEPGKDRWVASGLALVLGPFAAHRLYLGTNAKVAIIYGLTFGGFGVLVLIDLGHLLFSKDIDAYRNNDRVLMWTREKPAPTPP